MLRRLVLSHRSLYSTRFPRQGPTTQIYSPVRARREFSSVPPGPGSTGKPSESGNQFSKVLVGSVAVGPCFFAAYSGGYLDDVLGKKQKTSTDPLKDFSDDTSTEKLPKDDGTLYNSQNIKEQIPAHTGEGSEVPDSDIKDAKESSERQSAVESVGDSGDLKPKEEDIYAKEEELPKLSDGLHADKEGLPVISSKEETSKYENASQKTVEVNAAVKSSEEQAGLELNEDLPAVTDAGVVFQGNNMTADVREELKSQNDPKDMPDNEHETSTPLLDTYNLREEVDARASTSSNHTDNHPSTKKETSLVASEDPSDAYVSKDGKLILDFIQAIHAAEQRQAELDARVLTEEKRIMKERYEKELKDARARELMYAEEAAMLEKEVKKERAKADAALKSLQERSEERLKMALEEKEREAESKLTEREDFAKAELAASIAREKAAQIERMTEANLNINALCMAFYARSEEARQTHSIHKLALGALALEDALSNGLPVQAELDALHVHIEGVDKDSLLELAVSSLPEDVRFHGTDSILQLNQKFDTLKGTLRHFSLIPPEGGGILVHSLARMASFLKVKETDQSGDGIESVINKVESLLAQGKLAEAADVLEDGVKGSKATEVVGDWSRRARNRAITEQALVLLQSYATSMSLT